MNTGLRRSSWLVLAILIALLVISVTHVYAQSTYQAVQGVSGGIPQEVSVGSTIGWEFKIAPDYTIKIDELGVLDTGSDGLARDHQVAIWDVEGTSVALVQATVGTSSSTSGGWAWTPVTPVTLSEGTYRIGAYFTFSLTTPEQYIVDATNVAAAPAILYQTGYSQTGTFQYPATTSRDNSYFGPNFRFSVEGDDLPIVPEPSAIALLTLGIVALFGVTLQNRK